MVCIYIVSDFISFLLPLSLLTPPPPFKEAKRVKDGILIECNLKGFIKPNADNVLRIYQNCGNIRICGAIRFEDMRGKTYECCGQTWDYEHYCFHQTSMAHRNKMRQIDLNCHEKEIDEEETDEDDDEEDGYLTPSEQITSSSSPAVVPEAPKKPLRESESMVVNATQDTGGSLSDSVHVETSQDIIDDGNEVEMYRESDIIDVTSDEALNVPHVVEIVPAEEETIPVEEEIVPAEEETTPVEEEIVPAEEETTPVEEEIVPEKESVPFEEETTPDEVTNWRNTLVVFTPDNTNNPITMCVKDINGSGTVHLIDAQEVIVEVPDFEEDDLHFVSINTRPVFTGTWVDGRFHFFGYMKFSHGCDLSYAGQFDDLWRKSGQGISYRNDKAYHNGFYKNGHFHGHALFYHQPSEDGKPHATYVGNYEFGNRHDKNGKLTWDNGIEKYEGGFLNNMFHGYGEETMIAEEGRIEQYKGDYLKGLRTGHGMVRTLEKSKPPTKKYVIQYDGQFKEGYFHGQGKLEWSNGDIFEGIFQEHQQWEGTLIATNGTQWRFEDGFKGKATRKRKASVSEEEQPRKKKLRHVINITGDGNCLFRAFSYLIYGTEKHHALMRKTCFDYMTDDEKDLLDTDERENFLQDGTYVGETVIEVMSRIYKCPVKLNKNNGAPHQTYSSNYVGKGRLLKLKWTGPEPGHYDAYDGRTFVSELFTDYHRKNPGSYERQVLSTLDDSSESEFEPNH